MELSRGQRYRRGVYTRGPYRTRKTAEERFWGKVHRPDRASCWTWTGNRDPNGYGQFAIRSCTMMPAHRYAYELVKGPIPEGLVLDHLCRVPSCVNPAHLEAVTQAENIRRGEIWAINGAKTHCKRGHEFTPENTYILPKSRSRSCRACRAENSRERYRASRGR